VTGDCRVGRAHTVGDISIIHHNFQTTWSLVGLTSVSTTLRFSVVCNLNRKASESGPIATEILVSVSGEPMTDGLKCGTVASTDSPARITKMEATN